MFIFSTKYVPPITSKICGRTIDHSGITQNIPIMTFVSKDHKTRLKMILECCSMVVSSYIRKYKVVLEIFRNVYLLSFEVLPPPLIIFGTFGRKWRPTYLNFPILCDG